MISLRAAMSEVEHDKVSAMVRLIGGVIQLQDELQSARVKYACEILLKVMKKRKRKRGGAGEEEI